MNEYVLIYLLEKMDSIHNIICLFAGITTTMVLFFTIAYITGEKTR